MVWRGALGTGDGSWNSLHDLSGMDVHKDTIVVAITAAGDIGMATSYGTFPNIPAALEKLVKRLQHAGSGPAKFCYEAGPCGYGVHRTLTKLGKSAWWWRRR